MRGGGGGCNSSNPPLDPPMSIDFYFKCVFTNITCIMTDLWCFGRGGQEFGRDPPSCQQRSQKHGYVRSGMLDNLYLYNNRVGKATSNLNIDSFTILWWHTSAPYMQDRGHRHATLLCRNARYLCKHVT